MLFLFGSVPNTGILQGSFSTFAKAAADKGKKNWSSVVAGNYADSNTDLYW